MKHPPVRAVFFDLDDTLCDAAPAFAYARELAFVSLQSRHPHLEIDRICQAWDAAHASLFAALAAGTLDMQGVRDRRFLRTLEALKVPDAALADALNYLLGEQQLARLRLFDDAEVLDVLRPRLHVGIITNGAVDGHPNSQASKARHLGLMERVDLFWASDAVGHRKPDSLLFLKVLGVLGFSPEETLFVGDHPVNDVRGAKAVGMTAVWLHRGKPWPVEHEDQPDVIIESLRELVPLLALPVCSGIP